jgi:hypothetical protein
MIYEIVCSTLYAYERSTVGLGVELPSVFHIILYSIMT